MEERTFSFKANINGKIKNLSFSIPIRDGYVITNKYCPQELLTGGLPFITVINGESIAEFISDCQAQANAFTSEQNDETIMSIHIRGLMSAIGSHINRCGRLIFGDLLIYMDCFSYLLQADNVNEKDTRDAYPRILRSVVDLYANFIKNTSDLSMFKGSRMDFILHDLSKN